MPDHEDILTPVSGIENLTYADVNILLNFQKLWTELILWMRNFFHSDLENLPDLASITTRVFQQLPQDFYNEFSKYFGPDDAQQFINIFSRLVTLNWQLVNAYKDNNQEAINTSTVQWYQSADEMAHFLAGINSHWNESTLKTMLYEYIRLKIQEIIAFLTGNYEQEIKIFNEIEDKATRMSAYLAMGIIARKPQRMQP